MKRLYRSGEDRKIAGGFGVLPYLVLWLLIPGAASGKK